MEIQLNESEMLSNETTKSLNERPISACMCCECSCESKHFLGMSLLVLLKAYYNKLHILLTLWHLNSIVKDALTVS